VNSGLPLALAWFPVVLLVQMMFITGLAMVLSAANVFVRDVMQAVPILLTFWMFTTPVFYDPMAISTRPGLGQRGRGALGAQRGTAMHFNPMAILIQIYRAIFSYGQVPFPLVGLAKLGASSRRRAVARLRLLPAQQGPLRGRGLSVTAPHAAVAEHLSKEYRLYPNSIARVKEALSFGRRRYHTRHRALDDVSFTVPQGSALGIVGENGAGKSTLLKVLAGHEPARPAAASRSTAR
jgi:ABC-type multidrug transport system fused ATPase/permease subunit